MSKIPFYAEVDFGGTVYLEKTDPVTGAESPLTNVDGAPDAVISIAEDSFVPALAGLTTALAYIGADDEHASGVWRYFFDGAEAIRAQLDALDTSGLCLLIRKAGDTWLSFPLKYVRVKRGTVAS